jgi:succinate dehydrogenase / fumarate reductase, flavoprotein subunit
VELTRKPLSAMRPDLLGLFDKAELKKYMTEEELAGLPSAPSAASASASASAPTEGKGH